MSSKGIYKWDDKDFPTGIEINLSANDISKLFEDMYEAERYDLLCEILGNLRVDEFARIKSWINQE